MVLWRSLDPKMLLAVLASRRPDGPGTVPVTKAPAVAAKKAVA